MDGRILLKLITKTCGHCVFSHGTGSAVGIATGYRLDGPRSEFQGGGGGRYFPNLSRPALGPT